MSAQQLREIFTAAQERFRPGALSREISYYFTFGPGPGEKWSVWLGPDRCEVKEGKHLDRADCVVKTSPSLFLRMVRKGYKPGAMDFMRGKIKSNDPTKLQLLKDCFA